MSETTLYKIESEIEGFFDEIIENKEKAANNAFARLKKDLNDEAGHVVMYKSNDLGETWKVIKQVKRTETENAE